MGYIVLVLLVVGLAVTYWPIALAVGAIGAALLYRRWQRRPQNVYAHALILDMPSGRARVNVVGEGGYQGSLEIVAGGRTIDGGMNRDHQALLVPEPSNRYDPNAVEVRIGGMRVGYLSREDAVAYRPAIDLAAASGFTLAAPASIQGGWDRGPLDRGNFGVILHMGQPAEVEAEIAVNLARPEP